MERRSFLKGLAAGSVLLALPTALTACGSNGSSGSSDGVLDYWLWQDDATDQTWLKLADEFNKQSTSFQVKLQVIPLAQYQDKLMTALSSGGGPDACRFKDWWLGEFVDQKAVAPLDSYLNSWSGKADVVQALYETGRVPGSTELYMLPHQYVTLYMYYRKSFFNEAGLQPPRTHADVLAAAARLTDANAKRWGIDVRGGAGGQDQWAAWLYSGGASMVDSSGKVILDDPAAIAVNQDYLDLETKLKVTPPGSVTAAFAQVISNFQSGSTAMLIHHPGSLGTLRPALGEDLGVVPMPSADPSSTSTLGTMSGNIVLASSGKKEQAWQWISWLSTKEPMLTMSTSKQGQLPVLTSAAQDPAFTKDEAFKVAIAAQSTAKSWPALRGTATVANKSWGPAIQSAFLGKTSSAEMMQQLAKDLGAQ